MRKLDDSVKVVRFRYHWLPFWLTFQTVVPPSNRNGVINNIEISYTQGDLPHPLFLACVKQLASVKLGMWPLLASLVVAGLPITSLLKGTPFDAISNKAVWGHLLDDVVRRLSHVMYSDAPSE